MTIALDTQQKPVRQNHSRLGVEVLEGCDINNLTTKQVKQLKQSLWQRGVVVIKRQNVKASELREFALNSFGSRIFGKPAIEIDPEIDPNLQSPGVNIVGNPKGPVKRKIERSNRKWHQAKDSLTQTKELAMNSLYVVMVYGVKTTSPGQKGYPHTTDFIDLLAAYNNLDDSIRRQLERMYLEHADSIESTKNDSEEDEHQKIHPIVSTHKVSGKKGLYLGEETATLVGMKHRKKEAREFWQRLLSLIIACTPIYSHVWQPGDLVLWDNSQVMHRNTFYDASKSEHIALRVGVIDESNS